MTDRARAAKFITFEGGEGAGKSTQVRLLVEKLGAEGITAIATREPGGSPGAEKIREAVLSGAVRKFGVEAEAMMFSAARVDHLDHTIRPALAKGTWVVCDRFADSTRAYQGAQGAVDPHLIAALERVAVGPTRPDLTLILDIAPETGLARAAARRPEGAAADRFEGEALEFHRGLRRAFLDIAEQEPKRCAVIDAALSVEEIAARVWSTVRVRLLDKPRRRKPKPAEAPRPGARAP